MPTVLDLQWSIPRNAEGREMVAGHEYVGKLGSTGGTALRHVIFKVSSISSLGWLGPRLLSPDDKIPS